MPFNFAVSTRKGAGHRWQEPGFTILSTLPKGFHHPTLGYVDSYVMHRFRSGARRGGEPPSLFRPDGA
jgi:hypothetical protein